MSLRSASARELIRELETLREPGVQSTLAFDADGTLWAGDVSEDVFLDSVRSGQIHDIARPALEEAAARFGIPTHGAAPEVALRIFTAYREGRYPERDVCEMMTWCYAGLTVDELRSRARAALENANIGARLNRGLEPILDWARSEGLRTIVVSASPRGIVEVAAELWQFSPVEIAASEPALETERILPRMQGEVPYEAAKCRAAARLVEGTTWLASFGDNPYDVDMMRAARLGVAVEPKVALRKLLPELPFVVLLT